jgi:hypothetical protein
MQAHFARKCSHTPFIKAEKEETSDAMPVMPMPISLSATNSPNHSNLSYLDSKPSLWVMYLLLLCLLRLLCLFLWRQLSANRPCQLWSEVKWRVFLLLVEQTEVRTLCRVDDGKNTSNSLADIGTVHPSVCV